jgi:hypothetical protein
MGQLTSDPRSIQLPGFVFKRRAVSPKQNRLSAEVMITARTERDPANFDRPRTTIFGVCATMPTLRPYGSDQVGNAYSDGPSEIMGKCG